MMDDDFEPWTNHDGTHVPAPDGTEVIVRFEDGFVMRGRIGEDGGGEGPARPKYASWLWAIQRANASHAVAYRLRRNRQIEELRRLAEDVPQPERVPA
jgi:hypothetical protein